MMDSNNTSTSHELLCIYDNKPWLKTDDFQDNVEFSIVASVLSITVSSIATISNILLIAAIFTAPKLKTPSYALIASQAFSDLLMALFLKTFMIFLALGVEDMLTTACYFWHVCIFIGRMGSWVSVLSSMLLSIDRYLAVYLGMRYKTIITLERVRIAVFVVWFSAPGVSTLYYFKLQGFVSTAVALLIIGTLCFSVMSFCYIKAFQLLRKHSKSSNNSVESTSQKIGRGSSGSLQTGGTGSNPNSRLELNKYRKSIWTLIIVEVVFVLLSLPIFGAWINLFINGASSTSILVVGYCCVIWALGSALNPGIHIYRMGDVRQACRSVLVRLRMR